MPMKIAIAWVALLGFANAARAWDAAGHQTVGSLADHLIAGTPAAAQVHVRLEGRDLATAAVWADCAKGVSRQGERFGYVVSAKYPECRPFEDPAGQARMVDFVRRNWDACHPAADEEPCHKQYHYTDVAIERDRYSRLDVGTSDHDVVAAVGAAIRVLRRRPAPPPFSIKDEEEALLLLAHDLGDLHQPLHVVALYLNSAGQEVDPDHGVFDPETKTRGGNRLRDGHRSLHTEWDDVPAALHVPTFAMEGIAQALEVPVSRGPVAAWPSQWADDTLRAGRSPLLELSIGNENADHTWPVSEPEGYAAERAALQRRQLILAGARLAQVLHKLFP